MDATTETMSVERTLSIEASPEAVWEFLVDPDKATRWMGQTCTFEAEPGGLYRCEVIPGHTARGEFIELDAPNRLVFTWGWENEERTPPGSSTVEIELSRDGDGTSSALRPHPLERRVRGVAFTRLGSLPAAPRDRCRRRRSG